MPHIPSPERCLRLKRRGRTHGRVDERWAAVLVSAVSFFLFALFFLACQLFLAQEAPRNVCIQVWVSQSGRPISPVWNYFGYDDPNSTCAPNARKLLDELAA